LLFVQTDLASFSIRWCRHHDHNHYESSPGSFDERRLSAVRLPSLRPGYQSIIVRIHHRHLLLLVCPKPDTHLPIYHPMQSTEG